MCQRLYPSVTLRACSSSHVYTYTVHNNGLKLTAGVRWYGAHACVVQGRERVILLLGWLAFRTWLLHYEISLSAGWAGARAFSKRICCSERASEPLLMFYAELNGIGLQGLSFFFRGFFRREFREWRERFGQFSESGLWMDIRSEKGRFSRGAGAWWKKCNYCWRDRREWSKWNSIYVLITWINRITSVVTFAAFILMIVWWNRYIIYTYTEPKI